MAVEQAGPAALSSESVENATAPAATTSVFEQARRTSATMQAVTVASAAQPKPFVQRPARAIRETIIGVAAPANGPAAPIAPAGVATAEAIPANTQATPIAAPGVATAEAIPAKAPFKNPRGIRQTIIGVAEPANAPHPGQPSVTRVATPVAVPRVAAPVQRNVRNLQANRTMIGGLEAASPQPPLAQGAPTSGLWSVLVPNQGAKEMSTDDVIEGVKSGRLHLDSRVWRDGQGAWKALNQVDALRAELERAGVGVDPAPAVAQGPTPITSAPPETSRLPLGSASTLRKPAGASFEDEVTKIAPSPWNVPDLGAQATAQLADASDRSNARVGDEPLATLERPSRRPDIGPRDTVRGQLAAIASVPAAPLNAAAEGEHPPAEETDAAQRTLDDRDVYTSKTVESATSEESLTSDETERTSSRDLTSPSRRTRQRRRIRQWLIISCAVALVLAVVSYRTKQPTQIYAYASHHGWDKRSSAFIQNRIVGPSHHAVLWIKRKLGKR
jgi:hypothetical protein